MPMCRELYPKDWKQVSLQIRERDGWRCKWCGAENSKPHPVTGSKVVLTVAHHPDSNPANCADGNLQALCQSCHNKLDAPMRARNRRMNKRRISGQMELIWSDDDAS
jgi:5-methylcytosine-specific restriction endonuclease McrA